jgi:chemotaxis protein CheD
MIYLEPGEVYLAESSTTIVTVLGSCLAVTMWVPRLRVGIICHALLPQCLTWNKCRDHCRERFRYLHCTIPWMIEQLRRLAVRRREVEIKLFGGGKMNISSLHDGEYAQVGEKNAALALKIFQEEGLVVVSQDLGGTQGRKIIFHTETGEVLLKRIKSL